MITTEKAGAALFKLIKFSTLFILFLPLVMNSHFFFPFIVFKNVMFRLAVEVIFIAYLVLWHLNPTYKPKFDLITKLVIAFFVISLIAGLLGVGIYSSFMGNYERMSGIFHHFHLVLYFFVLVNVFREKKDWHSFLTFSIFASAIMSFIAFAQWLGIPFILQSSGGSRLSGTVGNPTFFATYLIFNLFFILYFLAKERRFDLRLFSLSFLSLDIFLVISGILFKFFSDSNWKSFEFLKTPLLNYSFEYPKFLYLFLLFQILIGLVWFLRHKGNMVRILLSILFSFEFFIFFQTQTRGAIIGFFAGITLMLIVSPFLNINKKIKVINLVILLIILASPFLLVVYKDSNFVQNNRTLSRLATISLVDITTESRLFTWQTSWHGWTDSLKSALIGYGPENYYYAFNKYFPPQIYKDLGSQIWFDRAHNIIFDVGVTTGVLGLFVYLSLLSVAVFSLYKGYKSNRSISSSWLIIALFLAYFAQNFFVFDTLNTEIPFYLLLAFVVFLMSMRGGREVVTEEARNKKINLIYLSALLVVLIGVFSINVKTLKANNYIFKALVSNQQLKGYNIDSYNFFKKAIEESVAGKFEARQQLANYVNGYVKIADITATQAKTMIDYTTEELKKSVEEEPSNVRHYLFLSSFYNATTQFNKNNPQKVITLMQKAIELSPTRPHLYYEIAQAYSFMGDPDTASAYFKKGVALAPQVIEDQLNLLSFYIVFQKDDLADAQYKMMIEDLNWQPTIEDYRKIIELYGRVKNYSKAIDFQQKLIDMAPAADEYAKLAAMYAKIGLNKEARDATQKAVDLNPAFASEAKKFLELLDSGKLLEQ